jgi:3-phenylpropionate/trans-cinnamate dioxygenase ferredoxin reductase subunit
VRKTYDVVIVGAGYAGVHAADTLRTRGFPGSVLIIGHTPKPPLARQYRVGSVSMERTHLRDAHFWRWQKIDLLIDTPASRLDPMRRTIVLGNGKSLGFGTCILATGARPQPPCFGASAPKGVHGVRSIADAAVLGGEIDPELPVVIAGADHTGLEAAAVLLEQGHPVTVVETRDRVLPRAGSPALARFLKAEHSRRGARFRFGKRIAGLEGRTRLRAVRLDDGERLEAALLIAKGGIEPATELAHEAGLACDDGIIVDGQSRTSEPHVFAIGDCARHDWRSDTIPPVEPRYHASSTAEAAVDAILGQTHRNDGAPAFWFDQFDLRIQSAGLLPPACSTTIRGDPASRSFSLLHFRGGVLESLDAINCAPDFTAGRKLIGSRVLVSPMQLADTATPLRDMMAATLN